MPQSVAAEARRAQRHSELRGRQGSLSAAEQLELAHSEKQMGEEQAARAKVSASAATYSDALSGKGVHGISDSPWSSPAGTSGKPLSATESANETVRLLTEIRDAVRARSGGYNQETGQSGGGQRKPKESEFFTSAGSVSDLLNVLSEKSASESQSGSNLAGFIYGIAGMARRRLEGYGGQKAGSIVGQEAFAFSDDRDKEDSTYTDGGSGFAPSSPQKAAKKAKAGEDEEEEGAITRVVRKANWGLSNLGVAAIQAGKAVYEFATAQEKEVRRLAEFGGQQAVGAALLDVGRIQRSVKTAQETGTSSYGLTSAINRFEDALRPIESGLTNLANNVGAALLDTMTEMVKLLHPIVKVLTEIVKIAGLEAPKGPERRLNYDIIQEKIKEHRQNASPQWPRGQVWNPWGNRK